MTDILQVAAIYGPSQARLEADYTVHRLWQAPDRDAFVRDVAPLVEVIVTTGGAGASRALIEQLPKLRLIACFGVGVDAIDLAAARERGVAVTNTPDVLTEATADMAWALLAATARRICESEHWLRAGHWKRWAWDQFLGQDLYRSRSSGAFPFPLTKLHPRQNSPLADSAANGQSKPF